MFEKLETIHAASDTKEHWTKSALGLLFRDFKWLTVLL
jgi:hypothetical protein